MEKISFWYRFFRFFCVVFLRLFFRFKTTGAENVPPVGGCIIASNHASMLDPPVLGCGVLHRQVHFLARETLFKNSLTRWWSNIVGVVPIDRTKGDIGAMRMALKVLKNGGTLALFPEGTRTMDGQLQRGKGGIGFLIAKAGVPVVPAYIDGTFAALPKGAKRLKFHAIAVRYGALITPATVQALLHGENAYQDIADMVMARIAELSPAGHGDVEAQPPS